mmetsp:Transcript_53172/g.171469  ORF Transcript_53172/g.171469 Transcript_53172/m.171469 type:complete len:221 (+) Transcript_53172:548-1210(+)
MTPMRLLTYISAQLVGAVVGAALWMGIISKECYSSAFTHGTVLIEPLGSQILLHCMLTLTIALCTCGRTRDSCPWPRPSSLASLTSPSRWSAQRCWEARCRTCCAPLASRLWASDRGIASLLWPSAPLVEGWQRPCWTSCCSGADFGMAFCRLRHDMRRNVAMMEGCLMWKATIHRMHPLATRLEPIGWALGTMSVQDARWLADILPSSVDIRFALARCG